jgi:hypothetical protein
MARIYKVAVYGSNSDSTIVGNYRRSGHAEYDDAARTFSEEINTLINEGYGSYGFIKGYVDDQQWKLEKNGNVRIVGLWSEEQK